MSQHKVLNPCGLTLNQLLYSLRKLALDTPSCLVEAISFSETTYMDLDAVLNAEIILSVTDKYVPLLETIKTLDNMVDWFYARRVHDVKDKTVKLQFMKGNKFYPPGLIVSLKSSVVNNAYPDEHLVHDKVFVDFVRVFKPEPYVYALAKQSFSSLYKGFLQNGIGISKSSGVGYVLVFKADTPEYGKVELHSLDSRGVCVPEVLYPGDFVNALGSFIRLPLPHNTPPRGQDYPFESWLALMKWCMLGTDYTTMLSDNQHAWWVKDTVNFCDYVDFVSEDVKSIYEQAAKYFMVIHDVMSQYACDGRILFKDIGDSKVRVSLELSMIANRSV